MICNLNRLSFSEYGKILPERAEISGWETRAFSGAPVQAYRSHGTVCLDYDTDMTVLAVSKDGAAFQSFYLDHSVALDAGVEFALIPCQSTCTVHMQSEAPWEKTRMLDAGELRLQITPLLELPRIYTLFYQEKEKGFFFKGESHEVLELTYVDKGAVHTVVGGVDYALSQGEMMIYGPGQWHMQYADMETAPSFITVTFELSGTYLPLLENRRFRLPQGGAQLLKTMLDERDRTDRFSGDLILNSLQRLLLMVLRSENAADTKLKTPVSLYNENEIVHRALTYIAEHVYEKLSVASVAREISVSSSYLTSLFHQRLHISPGEYIRRIKLEESKLLIREGRLNVTQIAQALQYSTVHHFSRQFKDKFGYSPTEYARAIR